MEITDRPTKSTTTTVDARQLGGKGQKAGTVDAPMALVEARKPNVRLP